MGKGEELTTTKYLIHAQINANGIVEKPDVVGAVFGQTEGLLSNDLDLRELQRTGRIGRIQVNIHSNGGRAKGDIVIPSSLDRVETAILAASLETINRVGPCEAQIQTLKVEDVRAVKREQVVNRAKEIYKNMVESVGPASMKMIEEVREAMRIHEISEYGDDRLPAGPSIHTSDAIIVVEGRSDVLNLLKYGIKNTVAVEGVSVPQSIGELSKKRTTTAFVDGDRGGELILKELLQIGDVDYITRAPQGKEVEDLEKDEVLVALRDKVPTPQFLANHNILSESDNNGHKKHNKHHHTLKGLAVSACTTLLMLYVFSLVIDNTYIANAAGCAEPSFHVNIMVFSMLYSPVDVVLSMLLNISSRKHEWQADEFARVNGLGKAVSSGLKRMSANSLANLTPHPLVVFMEYSHPTLLQRVRHLEN